jgi:hypothetical protein
MPRSFLTALPLLAACTPSLSSHALAQVACCPTHSDANALPQGEPASELDVGCGKARMLMLRAAQGQLIADGAPGFATREAFTDTDLLTVDLDIAIDPLVNNTIAGSNVMRVRSKVAGLTQFTFMLRSNFAITLCTVNGVAASVAAPPTNSYARTITLPRAYALNEEFDVRIEYNGPAVSRGFGSIAFTTQNNQAGGVPIVATLSEAYYAATWWPIKDGDVFQPGDNSDKSTGRISITAPSQFRSVANGLLESVDELPGGKRRYRWRTTYPTSTYLWAFSTTQYNTWTQTYTYPIPGGGTGTMPVEFNIYPASDTPANRAAWELVLPMLNVFRPLFGEYPFINEKYGIYQFPFGGGMEHQTNSGQGTFNEGVTAHELAHQWWGDMITCKTWNDIWLNEGFASYSEALWRERRPGNAGLDSLQSFMNSRRPSSLNGSVYVYATSDMNRIFSSTFSYNKGSWVLHTLRHTLGDQAFFATLAAYRAQYAGSAATTDQFRAVAEAVSGQNLEGFFDALVYGIGAPTYVAGFEPVTIDGARWVRVSLQQTHDASWGDGGTFPLPVTLRLTTNSSSSDHRVSNTARTQHYLLPAVPGSDATSGLAIDPRDWILKESTTIGAYVQGPVKVVSALPAPGSTAHAAPSQLTIRFSDSVTISPSQFLVTSPAGPVPFTLSQPEPSLARLTFAQPLAAGPHSVRVDSTINANGRLLDGEVLNNALPSGDGLPGSSALWSFTVAGCNSIDFNRDGLFPDDSDLIDFLSVLAGGPCSTPSCDTIDFNNDALFPDDADLIAFLRVLAGGDC